MYRLALERQEATRLRLLSEMLLEKRFGRLDGAAGRRHPGRSTTAQADLAEVEAKFRKGLISREELEKAAKEYEIALIESGLRKDEVMAASKGLTQAESTSGRPSSTSRKRSSGRPLPGSSRASTSLRENTRIPAGTYLRSSISARSR